MSMERTSSTTICALFRRLTHGVYVIGVAHGPHREGFTAAWVAQASFDPPFLAVSVNPENASYPLLKASGRFAVSVLKGGQLDLARRFGTRSGRDLDKFDGIPWRPAPGGAPILEEALAWFECRLAGSLPAGDHEIVLGRVVDGALLDQDAEPMTYKETGDMDDSRELYPERF
jgi:flavin reductase (DIM6/NTAB) family NADH-FMN oxidoreductase RutF